ncbi:ABC transporter permease [Anaerolentibacter hominis]|uniref:ABC transporter permease n=1 Tax=Anaerolentibacter hominis TaxID=3079009 RepID=UPI0031B8934F
MKKYILKRLLIAIPTFFGITVLVYVISNMATGSPVAMILGGDTTITAADIQALEHELGLDQPVIVQYFRWLGQMFQGNLGMSYRSSQPVLGMIMERIGPTLLLTISATVFSMLIAIPLGIMSAYKPYTGWDYISSGLSFVGSSMPNFFAGLLLIYFFSVKLKLLPMGGMYDSAGNKTLGSLLIHMLMPMVVLAIQQIGNILRQTRGSMLEVLNEDYIRTARAKGLGEGRVVIKHALRNALIPVVTVLANNLPFIIGGAVVTEQIFGWPGLGSLMVTSINSRDYPTIMGISVFVAIFVLLGNILLDIVYGILDPKIRHSR